MNPCGCQVGIFHKNCKANMDYNISRMLCNNFEHLFGTAGWQTVREKNPSARKSELRTPKSPSIHPAGVSLRKTLNGCWLLGRCCVADPDLWSLTSSIKNFPEGISKVSHRYPQAVDLNSCCLHGSDAFHNTCIYSNRLARFMMCWFETAYASC